VLSLKLKKNLTQIRFVVFEKTHVTEPKARRLGYSKNRLKSC